MLRLTKSYYEKVEEQAGNMDKVRKFEEQVGFKISPVYYTPDLPSEAIDQLRHSRA